jgi:alpha-1,3-mannosyltransferase
MRVAHLVRQFRPGIGGLEEAVLQLAGALSHKVDIEIVTLDRLFDAPNRKLPQHEVIDGLPVTRLPWFGSRRYPVAPDFLRAIDKADIVHVHAIDFFFDAVALTKPLHRKTLVASTHGGFFHTKFASTLKDYYFRSITRFSAGRYDAICASSDNDFNIFSRISGRMHRIGNGVDSTKWRDRASPSVNRTLIYFGRFSKNKRIDLVFPLLSALREDGEDWKLIIAGKPWDVSVDELAQQAAAFPPGTVTIHPIPSDEELGRLISDASFYVSASEHEGFGISVVEAMAAGLFPVLSHIPAFETLAAKAGTGILLDSFDAPEAAQTVRQARENFSKGSSAQRRQMLEAAESYDWKTEADKLLALYADLQAKRGTR